jgi:hypothetical protein
MMERAVKRGLTRRRLEAVKTVGLDEKSFGAGQSDVSVLTDLQERRILEVTPGNDAASACASGKLCRASSGSNSRPPPWI